MATRIAIPEPTSGDAAYNGSSLPPYLAALESAGATPVVIPVNEGQNRIAQLLATVQGILLPGSGFDVDPQIYGEASIPACGLADPIRAAADELLLQDAFNLQKPILAICYGIQSMNVWRNGTLIQDLAHEGKTSVNHAPGRQIVDAHSVEITPGSRLFDLLPAPDAVEQVNSSHHQALRVPGDNLRVTAVSPTDQVIEAVELDSPEHWVVGVQWHPERTYSERAFSRAIFAAFVEQASRWQEKKANGVAVSA